MSIFKWLSTDGEKVYGQFACIIGKYIHFHQMSELGVVGQSSINFDPELRNVSFALKPFMGYPAILSALQPFQICIYKRKYSIWTFSNGSQVMGKRFMANLHASLERTCKGRISNISTRCQNWGGQSSFNFWCWTQKCKFCIDIFYGISCNTECITATSNLHLQENI